MDWYKRLHRNRKIFNEYLKLISNKELKDESFFSMVKALSGFAVKSHIGKFSDVSFERIIAGHGKAQEFAEMPAAINIAPHDTFNIHTIFHIATTLYTVGGHASFISNLVRLDVNHKHVLIVTDQGIAARNKKIEELFDGGQAVRYLETGSAAEKARIIREMVNQPNSMVMLHTHPDDCTPLLAFHENNHPPVAYINHSDHTFWLGVSICDLVVNIRQEAEKISIQRRGVPNNCVIPIPLEKRPEIPNTSIIRSRLGVSGDTILMISVGAAYKFHPNKQYDFFRTCAKIIDRNQNVLIKVIGLKPGDFKSDRKYLESGKIALLGTQEDLYDYKVAADFVLDPMPYGSYTSLLEGCMYGAFPVVTYNTHPLFDLSRDIALRDDICMTYSEDDYLNVIEMMVKDKEKREQLRSTISHKMFDGHCGHSWMNAYEQLFLDLEMAVNNPIKTKVITDKPTELDEFLVGLQKGDVCREYGLLLNSLYSNAHVFSLKDGLSLCRLTNLLCENETVFFKAKMIVSLLKRGIVGQ